QIVRIESALLAHDRVEVTFGVDAERLVLLDQVAVGPRIGVLPPAPRVVVGRAVERAAAVADGEHPRPEEVAGPAVAVEQRGECGRAVMAAQEAALVSGDLIAGIGGEPGGEQLVNAREQRIACERLVGLSREPWAPRSGLCNPERR